MYCLQRATKIIPPLRGEQCIPSAQIKRTLQTQPGITYAQVTKKNSYAPTNIEQEPQTNQSHQQASDMQDLKIHDNKPV
jgi:membrane-associated HD superfamily phosphohydrolase